MKFARFLFSFLAVVGLAILGWGLFKPLVEVPVLGSIRYTDSQFGGTGFLWTVVALLAVSVACSLRGDGSVKIAWFLWGLALGLTGASLVAMYRDAMDKLQQLAAPSEIQTLLAGVKIGSGGAAICAGLSLFALSMLPTLRNRTPDGATNRALAQTTGGGAECPR